VKRYVVAVGVSEGKGGSEGPVDRCGNDGVTGGATGFAPELRKRRRGPICGDNSSAEVGSGGRLSPTEPSR
jgi:hypothetical protein